MYSHPDPLKVIGWWSQSLCGGARVYVVEPESMWGARVYVVAHEILVSAQGPLVLRLGLKGLGLKGLGPGLDN